VEVNKMNTNTEEWGNIELPGLSDEELFKKNWTLVAANREVVKKREVNGWAEKNAISCKNRRIGWADTISESAIKTRQKEGWKEDWLKTIEERNNDLDYQKNLKEGIAKRTANPDWQKKNAEKAKKLNKAIITPDGEFESVKACCVFYNITDGTLRNRIKKLDGWKYKNK
jgi:hypothetical protein